MIAQFQSSECDTNVCTGFESTYGLAGTTKAPCDEPVELFCWEVVWLGFTSNVSSPIEQDRHTQLWWEVYKHSMPCMSYFGLSAIHFNLFFPSPMVKYIFNELSAQVWIHFVFILFFYFFCIIHTETKLPVCTPGEEIYTLPLIID